MDTLKSGLMSPGTLMMVFGLMAVVSNSKDEMTMGVYFLPLLIVAGMAGGALLVTKLENSEWRKDLKRRVAEKERELKMRGAGAPDARAMSEAAANMGLASKGYGPGPASDGAEEEERPAGGKKED
mmetsp:Transcript_43629/g.135765  ORF Transcript_43629/g.135765 Transcript_43629/m.135765 type:complete len:126 (-) Transcript_43629:83-460(-)